MGESWLHEAVCRQSRDLCVTVGYIKLCVDRELNCVGAGYVEICVDRSLNFVLPLVT